MNRVSLNVAFVIYTCNSAVVYARHSNILTPKEVFHAAGRGKTHSEEVPGTHTLSLSLSLLDFFWEDMGRPKT